MLLEMRTAYEKKDQNETGQEGKKIGVSQQGTQLKNLR